MYELALCLLSQASKAVQVERVRLRCSGRFLCLHFNGDNMSLSGRHESRIAQVYFGERIQAANQLIDVPSIGDDCHLLIATQTLHIHNDKWIWHFPFQVFRVDDTRKVTDVNETPRRCVFEVGFGFFHCHVWIVRKQKLSLATYEAEVPSVRTFLDANTVPVDRPVWKS